jgi:hypothetical protein
LPAHFLLCFAVPQGWDRAAACTPCGEGPWLSEPSDVIISYDASTGFGSTVYVHGSPNSCYIQQGMGVDSTGKARICPPNTFGNHLEKRFGTDPAPCMSCLSGLVTSGDDGYRAVTFTNSHDTAEAISEGGFYSVLACVTPAGFGYTSLGAEECAIGTYNEGGNLLDCKP